jgi:hypothetical protein
MKSSIPAPQGGAPTVHRQRIAAVRQLRSEGRETALPVECCGAAMHPLHPPWDQFEVVLS